ncbi:MAG: orotate phosphoribosyltransferase [Methanobacterium sp.]|uniref:orotate phosphoribosyltransferase n=1 Tax=Methanobacterium sp. TaxID=2164 RepID=UPI003C720224
MELNGICTSCGSPGKMYTCNLCGNIVCGNCYNLYKGICQSCEKVKTGETIKTLK